MSQTHEQPDLFETDSPEQNFDVSAMAMSETKNSTKSLETHPDNAAEIINATAEDYYNRHKDYEVELESYEPRAFYDLGYEDPNEPVQPTVGRDKLLRQLRDAGEFKIYNAIRNNKLGNLFVRLDHFGEAILADSELDETEKREEEIKKFNEAAQKVGLPSAYSFIQLAYLMEHFPDQDA